jgi:maltose/maltodextrin transport system permease protein
MSALVGRLQIPHLLVALLAIPSLYLTIILYQTGNIWIALSLLVLTCLGVFIYLNPSASTFRYLFPGFIGFGIFVIFPLAYTVYIGFTKYSSQNLLRFDRAAALFHNETFLSPNAASYKFKIYAQEDGNYILYLEDEKDSARRFVSEPFELTPGAKPKTEQEPVHLNALPSGEEIKGNPLTMVQINKGKLLVPMRARQFAFPDETLVALAGLTNFAARERLWTANPDGSLTNKKDGTVIRLDKKLVFFLNDKVEKI